MYFKNNVTSVFDGDLPAEDAPARACTVWDGCSNNAVRRRFVRNVKFFNQPPSAHQPMTCRHIQHVVTAVYTVHKVSDHETLQRFFLSREQALHAHAEEHAGISGWICA